MITATSGTMCSPVVRVMEPSIAYTKPVLDSGAMGIVFPMITSKETAEAAVAAVRYPPIGERGWGPFYAPMRWQKKDPIEYYKSSDDVVIISLIEHIDAINNIEEIIFATNPTMEGEATAMYIQELLSELKTKPTITMLARGLPTGADLEYSDFSTLSHAFENRSSFN